MENGINLLPEITEREIKSGVYQKKINIVALGSVAAVGIIILALFAYQLYRSAYARTIENKTKVAVATIDKNASLEITQTALKEKLDKIQAILVSEIPTSELIDEITKAAQTSQPISINGLSAQSDGTVLVEGAAVNSGIFSEWINNLTSDNGQDYFSKVNVVSLTGDPSGYKFSFRMIFLKKGVYEQK